MRVSTNHMVEGSLLGIRSAFERFVKMQERTSTGKQLSKPSDDPPGVAKALSLQSTLDSIEQWQRNIEDATAFLGTVDSALDQAQNLLRQARTLGIQAATDSINVDSRAALANQIASIINQLGAVGNTTYRTRYVFAGQQTLQAPFIGSMGGGFTYRGGTAATADADLFVTIGQNETMLLNATGDKVFGQAFSALIALRDNIANNQIRAISDQDLSALDEALSVISGYRAEAGSKVQALNQAKQRLQQTQVTVQEQLSTLVDADLPKTIIELQNAERAFQAALVAAAKGFQQSLLDFLR
jgi:flagellar hook-associated protein 3 FlgL